MSSNFELCISFLFFFERERERERETFLFVVPPNVHLIPKEEQKAKYVETRYSLCRFSRVVRIIGILEGNLEITVKGVNGNRFRLTGQVVAALITLPSVSVQHKQLSLTLTQDPVISIQQY